MSRTSGLWVVGVLGAALLAGCDQDPTGREREGQPRPAARSADQTTASLATPRVGLELRATGAFRPGSPIVVTTTATGRHGAAPVGFELVVLDEEGTVDTEGRGNGRSVGRFRGQIGRGNQRQLTATVTFPRAGYYRVLAVANSELAPDLPQTVGDSVLIDLSSEYLHLLVDERGGRVTPGYDPTAVAGRTLLYGSVGPFIEEPSGGARTGAAMGRDTEAAIGGRHVLQYNNPAAPTAFFPVPNAQVTASCLSAPSGSVVGAAPSVQTASDGSFTVSCASGYYRATAQLRNTIAQVMNTDGTSGGLEFTQASATNVRVINNHAGRVHVLLNRYVPIAQQRFGMQRGPVKVYVNNNTAVNIQTNYTPGEDAIRQNHHEVFGERGLYTTIHEYGHAYHWVAVEKPYAYDCGTAKHELGGQYNANCAFVEGFAGFFSAFVAGDSLYYVAGGDYSLETQTFFRNPDGTIKDGSQVEGAFGGFLYDLVDGPSHPDGLNNETGLDDGPGTPVNFTDGVQYPASAIVNSMKHCTLGAGGLTYEDLFSTHDLVYCLENGVSAYDEAWAIGGYDWSYMEFVNNPTSLSFNDVRRLWKRNFYNAP